MKRLIALLIPLLALAASCLDARNLRLRWADTSSSELGFVIERSTDGQSFAEVHRTGPDETMWVDASAQPLVPYWYRVYAFNAGGDSGFTQTVQAILRGELINVSTRGFVGTGDQVMIVGFVVHHDPVRVLIRAVGPGLAQLGVPGTLPDPMFRVERMGQGGGQVVSNDDWSDPACATVATATGAFALPAGSADAAVVTVLEPGQYTIICSGKDGLTGIAIGEVYSVLP